MIRWCLIGLLAALLWPATGHAQLESVCRRETFEGTYRVLGTRRGVRFETCLANKRSFGYYQVGLAATNTTDHELSISFTAVYTTEEGERVIHSTSERLQPGETEGGMGAFTNLAPWATSLESRCVHLDLTQIRVRDITAEEEARAAEELREEELRQQEESRRAQEEERRQREEELERQREEEERRQQEEAQAAAEERRARQEEARERQAQRQAAAEARARQRERERQEGIRTYRERAEGRIAEQEQRDRDNQEAFAQMGMMMLSGTPQEYQGLSWRFAFYVGLDMPFFPVIKNDHDDRESSTGMAGGSGLGGGLSFWPVHSPSFALSLDGGVAAGAFSTGLGTSSGIDLRGGATLSVGHPRIAFVLSYAKVFRLGSATTEILNEATGTTSRSAGGGTGVVDRTSGGIRLGVGKLENGYPQHRIGLSLLTFRHETERVANARSWGVELVLELVGVIRLGVELGFAVPALGPAEYDLQDSGQGTSALVFLGWMRDYFGKGWIDE